jgi:hypothetical protein
MCYVSIACTNVYVAVGDPGTIDVFDTKSIGKLGTVATEKGAHTSALAAGGDQVYGFLPQSHCAAVYQADHM